MIDCCEVVEYRSELRSQVLQLQTHLWGPSHSQNANYFAWKHEQTPYVGTPRIFVALRGDEVIGMRALFATRWQVAEGQKTGYCLADSVVHPDHRGQGVLRSLTREIIERSCPSDFPCLFTFSASPATERLARSMGGCHLGPLHDYVFRTSDESTYSSDDPVVEMKKPLAVEMANLIERLPRESRIHHVRDEQYFRWRFANPRSRYVFLYWLEGTGAARSYSDPAATGKSARPTTDSVKGYLVLRLKHVKDSQRASILDWEAETPEIATAVLRAAIQSKIAERYRIWTATLSDESRRILREAGFSPCRHRNPNYPSILIHPLSTTSGDDVAVGIETMSDTANWDLRMLYCDNH